MIYAFVIGYEKFWEYTGWILLTLIPVCFLLAKMVRWLSPLDSEDLHPKHRPYFE